jgi:hypothetical protein
MVKPGYAEMDAIPRSLNALALLASGNADHLPLVKKDAEWAAGYSAKSMQTWYYGYCMVFLAEYVLATGDESVLPGLKRLALEAAKGQSAVGSWGHGFAIPDGRLGGYGMMNSPGVVLTIGLVLAREAGGSRTPMCRPPSNGVPSCCGSTPAKGRSRTAITPRGWRVTQGERGVRQEAIVLTRGRGLDKQPGLPLEHERRDVLPDQRGDGHRHEGAV